MANQGEYKDLTPSYLVHLVVLYGIFGILFYIECPEDRTFIKCQSFYGEEGYQIYNPGDVVEFHSLDRRLKWVFDSEIQIN